MISCIGVCKEYNNGGSFFAVNNVTLSIKNGEFVALCGKSGSGKSTLLNMIGLIDIPTSGEIEIDGINTKDMSPVERAQLRNKLMGYIFQSFYLEPAYTVFMNVEIPLLIANVPSKERKKRVEFCLEQVGMLHKQNSNVVNLSGGEKQRVCIARALANNPKLIIADEPCGNLDSENTANIMSLLKTLNKSGTTILMVTHSPEDAKEAQRIITLKDGKIITDET
ncbi:MAG: ABC transporter ATP-binding protein [Acutalibacteraceae bacterium]|nr:ABC transporter ATP-binding protein [Acutalibacteraceae bacterium]